MDYSQKKEKLREYIVALGRLERKCEDASRWAAMAENGEPDGSNRIKSAALDAREDCERLAGQANDLRLQLSGALERMPTERRRQVLEYYYLNGFSTSRICTETGWSKRYIQQLHSEAIRELGLFSRFFYFD